MGIRAIIAAVFLVALGNLSLFAGARHAHAELVTFYEQLDASGDMTSPQANFQTASIASESIGTIALGQGPLSITFSLQDPNASSIYGQPGGVAFGTCATCQDLQTYSFTDADRAVLADGAFHTFTVITGTTTRATADGGMPVYIDFFNLSQYHNSTHVKSNAAGTIPFLKIQGTPSPPLSVPQAPVGSVTLYAQNDASAVMTNSQQSSLTAFIDSASLGNLRLGQGKLYLTFTLKDPNASTIYGTPEGICLEPAGTRDCNTRMQIYRFTDAERMLLSDGAFHTFTVETGTTTDTYADGTRPVAVGFFNLSQYQHQTQIKSNASSTIPYLIIQAPPPPEPCAAPGACASNVLFLPGIEGSRLYEGTGCGKVAEEKLWEPFQSAGSALRGVGDGKVKELFLDQGGESVCADIYVKADGIIDSVRGSGIYQSLIDQMNGLVADGTMSNWKPIAYDWRLSLDALLHNGTERGGKVFYEEATSTPYIEQTLRALAASSKTGKVTIVAHSNGGLVAKALLQKLGAESSALVDKVLLAAVPQTGAPQSLGVTLVGYDAGIYKYGFPILSNSVARSFAQNSPMAYHLLPSEDYLTSIASDTAHAVIHFSGSGYAKEKAAYGETIGNGTALSDFLLARESGRAKPKPSDLNSPEVLNASLLQYAKGAHTALDVWTPPAGIEVDQIAGWGTDTVAGIDFYTTSPGIFSIFGVAPKHSYRPVFTEDGDGTVPVPSALAIASSTNVKRYWVDLDSYYKATKIRRSHADIFEIPAIEQFVAAFIKNSSFALPAYFSLNRPASLTSSKKLIFSLHTLSAPRSTKPPPKLAFRVTDSSGMSAGISGGGIITQDIPGSSYGEFGDMQYAIVPEGDHYQLVLQGLPDSEEPDGGAGGWVALDLQEAVDGAVTSTATLAEIPVTASTTATLLILSGIDTASPLMLDEHGDGNTVTITPIPGQIVNYEPREIEPAHLQVSGGAARGSGYSRYVPLAVTPEPVTAPIVLASASGTPSVTNTPLVPVRPRAVQRSLVVADRATVSGAGMPRLEQTASVYDASQQRIVARLGSAFYNGLHVLWTVFKRFF